MVEKNKNCFLLSANDIITVTHDCTLEKLKMPQKRVNQHWPKLKEILNYFFKFL